MTLGSARVQSLQADKRQLIEQLEAARNPAVHVATPTPSAPHAASAVHLTRAAVSSLAAVEPAVVSSTSSVSSIGPAAGPMGVSSIVTSLTSHVSIPTSPTVVVDGFSETTATAEPQSQPQSSPQLQSQQAVASAQAATQTLATSGDDTESSEHTTTRQRRAVTRARPNGTKTEPLRSGGQRSKVALEDTSKEREVREVKCRAENGELVEAAADGAVAGVEVGSTEEVLPPLSPPPSLSLSSSWSVCTTGIVCSVLAIFLAMVWLVPFLRLP